MLQINRKMNLKKLVKNNETVLRAYQAVGNCILHCAGRFISCDDRLILFVSYGGRYYNDSPMYIYERMREDPRFRNYRLVWAFVSPEEHQNIQDKVKIDTPSFYKIALSARCWITNNVVERGLDFKPKHCFYFHTTHVTLPKLCNVTIP